MTMYQSLHADGTSVSTFLCTRKLWPEEVSVSLIAVSGAVSPRKGILLRVKESLELYSTTT